MNQKEELSEQLQTSIKKKEVLIKENEKLKADLKQLRKGNLMN